MEESLANAMKQARMFISSGAGADATEEEEEELLGEVRREERRRRRHISSREGGPVHITGRDGGRPSE